MEKLLEDNSLITQKELYDIQESVRRYLEFRSPIRRIFQESSISGGTMPYYGQGGKHEAIMWDTRNAFNSTLTKYDEYFLLHIDELSVENEIVEFQEIKSKNKNYIEVFSELVCNSLINKEIRICINLVDQLALRKKIPLIFQKRSFKQVLYKAFSSIEKNNIINYILTGEKGLDKISKDPTYTKRNGSKGKPEGHVCTADVYKTELINDNSTYLFGSGSENGILAIRYDIINFYSDKLSRIITLQEMGMGITNFNSVCVIK